MDWNPFAAQREASPCCMTKNVPKSGVLKQKGDNSVLAHRFRESDTPTLVLHNWMNTMANIQDGGSKESMWWSGAVLDR